MEDKVDIAPPRETPEGPTIRALFEQFKTAEVQKPDPEEIIIIGKLDPNSIEYQRLHGKVGLDQLESGRVKRQDLLDAGFVFLNKIGEGEKPIFKTPEFEHRVLLTAEEIGEIKNAQKTEIPDTELDDVRFDMFSFLVASQCDYPFRSIGHLQSSLPSSDHGWHTGTKADWDLVDKYWRNEMNVRGLRWNQFFEAREPFLLEDCKDIYVPPAPTSNFLSRFVRGREVYVIEQRADKIAGSPSPFLDSGFHFGRNPDVTILDPKTRRMNMVTIHLLSRGLSEIGDSKNSFDQHYITLNEYMQDIYPTNLEERQQNYAAEEQLFHAAGKGEEILEEIQRRMIRKARDWQTQQREQQATQSTLARLRGILKKLR